MYTLKSLKKEFHQHYGLVFVIFVFFMAAVASFFTTRDMRPSSAASLSQFKAGNIISDAVMSNYNSMSVADIQNFLDSKNKCDNRDYNLYLQYKAAHPTINWHWENDHFVCLAEERFGDGEVIGSGMTAAEIIYDAAKQSHINPQVLLVLLQKESSLITDKVPNDFDYRKATGYGCPDTAACDSKYYGFKNQVYRAAELFRYVLDHNSAYYPAGRTVYVGYHPSSSCGGTQVYIENRATAALYQYTPYQPNSAALNAGYGTGNSCSAYGNRNFYLYFSDWFGNTQAAVDGELITIPDGEYNLSSAVATQRSLGLSGSNATLATLSTADNTQRWQFKRDASTGYYQITNVSTKQPLIAQSTEPQNGTKVVSGASTTCSKNWKIYRTKDNYLTLESACVSGMVLDVTNGSSSIGTQIQTYITDGTNAQKWQLWVGQTLDDGAYIIQSNANPDLAMDIYGGYTDDGTNIQLWSKHSEQHQRWYLEYHQDGDYYTITNPSSQKRLDLNAASVQSGQNIQLWRSNNSCAQKWHIIKNDTSYSISSNCSYDYTIGTKDRKTTQNTNIQLEKYDSSMSQNWQFTKLTPVVADGIYAILSSISPAKSLDVYGEYTQEGTNVELYDYHEGVGQQWKIIYNQETDDYSIMNPNSGKYLDINKSNVRPNENIQIWSKNSGCNQRWNIKKDEQYYIFTSACDGSQALDLYGGYIQNRTNIQIWNHYGGAPQKWLIRRVEL